MSNNRIELAQTLYTLHDLPPAVMLGIDRFLLGKIIHSFSDQSLSDDEFLGLAFEGNGSWSNCAVTKCSFINCVLDFDKISNCTFIACSFVNTQAFGDYSSCFFYEGSPIATEELDNTLNPLDDDAKEDNTELDKRILGLFYRKGSQITRINKISTITDLLSDNYDRKVILKRIERLVKKDCIFSNGDNAWIRKAGSDYFNTLK